MTSDLLRQLGCREITKNKLFELVEADFSLLPSVLEGILSSKATVRYGCGSALVNLSEKHPDKLYPYMNNFVALLDSKYRILTWNAMAVIANLTAVDIDRKFDTIFDKYYSFLGNEYMATVANVVVNSAIIVANKPYLSDKIAVELLKVQKLQTTPHLTEECKLVIVEQTLKTLETFFDRITNKEQVVAFTQKYVNSSRDTLRKKAQEFIKKDEN